MREILFRGKRLDNGEWAEGYLVASRKNTYPDGCEIITVEGINYDELDYYHPSFTSYAVDPDTVGQYTGLTDKNGKKIFEGDVMEFEAYGIIYRGVVTIDGGNTGIFCKGGSPFLDDAIKRHDSAKIGNIHDNPELLNKEA